MSPKDMKLFGLQIFIKPPIYKGAGIEDIELVKEFDKDVCLLTLGGESVQSHQQVYINNQALIEPVLYQKALNRIRDIVFKAVDQVKESSKNRGGRS